MPIHKPMMCLRRLFFLAVLLSSARAELPDWLTEMLHPAYSLVVVGGPKPGQLAAAHFTWQHLRAGGVARAGPSHRAAAFLVSPDRSASEAAALLGRTTGLQSPSLGDASLVVVEVRSGQEAAALLATTGPLSDQPRLLALQTVRAELIVAWTRAGPASYWQPQTTRLQEVEQLVQQGEMAGLAGSQLRVSFLTSPPNVMAGAEGLLWGYELEMLQLAADQLRLIISLSSPLDGEWGRPLAGSTNCTAGGMSTNCSGGWSGLVGELAAGRADLAISSISVERDRATVAAPGFVFGADYVQIFAPGPRPLPPLLSLLRPLDPASWLLLPLLLLFTPPVLHRLLAPLSRGSRPHTGLYLLAAFTRESVLAEFYRDHALTSIHCKKKGQMIILTEE